MPLIPQEIRVTTTGTGPNPIILSDLGEYSIPHPTSSYNMLSPLGAGFTLEEIQNSIDFQSAVSDGWITITDRNNTPITTLDPVVTVAGRTGIVVIAASDIGNGSVSNTEFQYLDGVTSSIQTQFTGKLSTTGGTLTGSLTFSTGLALQTGTTAANTLLLRAYDVDGASYTTFATLTAGNTPTFDLSDSTTKGGQYIYRAAGTDVPVSDGGTGVSSLTAYAPVFGGTTSTGPVQSGSTGTVGQVLTSNGASSLPTFQAPSTSPPYVEKTANYAITANDYTINCTANSFTLTLPTAVGITGKVYVIKNSGTGSITVTPNGSELIDDSTNMLITVKYTSIMIQSTGTGWIIL